VSYLCGLFPDSFQTTKRHSYYVYSIYMPSFNSFLEAVYPVGVTTNRSCFTRTISHNSRNLYWSCTKVDTEIHFNVPVLCAKFQLDPSMHSHFTAIFLRVHNTATILYTKPQYQTVCGQYSKIQFCIIKINCVFAEWEAKWKYFYLPYYLSEQRLLATSLKRLTGYICRFYYMFSEIIIVQILSYVVLCFIKKCTFLAHAKLCYNSLLGSPQVHSY